MKRTQLEKDLIQSGKELSLVAKGELVPRPARDFLDELKAKHGGARAGAGKKSPMQTKYPNEVKKRVTLRLYPTQLKEISGKFGSLQAAVDEWSKGV